MNDCVFCKIINGEIPTNKIYEDDNVLVILDTDPHTDGHMLVIPKRHYTDFTELDNDILIKINEVAKKMKDLIYSKLNAQGVTLTINYGLYQVVKHFHLHLVPAYPGKKKLSNIKDVYSKLK